MDNTNNIPELTEEESEKYKKQLTDYFSKLTAENPELLLDYLQDQYTQDLPSIERPKKLLICPHEIVITVIANVLEENEKGEVIGTKEICQKDYHIPVPPTHDYNIYMESFFSHLENCITASAKQGTKESEPKNDQ
jgi:hypothetical protein